MPRKEFLTPPSMPLGVTCRTLKMPSSGEWLGIFNSALLDMLEAWRYEQVNETDLTIQETIDKVNEVLAEFWSSSECDICLQPNGMPFIRLGEFGEFQMLGNDGWGAPTGDYAIPPVTPREGGTDEDKRCLASANAANVLAQFYEEVSDSAAAHKTVAEAISGLLLAIAAILAAPVSLAVAALIAIIGIVFDIFYDTAEFVTADYWSSEFTDSLQCALYTASTVDGEGVVTFNWSVLNEEIARSLQPHIDPMEAVLYGQVQVLISIIGIDGVNLAGATTAITSADCSECRDRWCFNMEFREDDFGWEPLVNVYGTYGTWVSGQGWQSAFFAAPAFPDNQATNISLTFSATITRVVVVVDYPTGGTVKDFYLQNELGTNLIFQPAFAGENVFLWDGEMDVTKITMGLNDYPKGSTTHNYIRRVQFEGYFENPFGEDNCTPS